MIIDKLETYKNNAHDFFVSNSPLNVRVESNCILDNIDIEPSMYTSRIKYFEKEIILKVIELLRKWTCESEKINELPTEVKTKLNSIDSTTNVVESMGSSLSRIFLLKPSISSELASTLAQLSWNTKQIKKNNINIQITPEMRTAANKRLKSKTATIKKTICLHAS